MLQHNILVDVFPIYYQPKMLMYTIENRWNINLLSPSARRKFPKVGYSRYCCLPTQNPLIALFLTALRAGILFQYQAEGAQNWGMDHGWSKPITAILLTFASRCFCREQVTYFQPKTQGRVGWGSWSKLSSRLVTKEKHAHVRKNSPTSFYV